MQWSGVSADLAPDEGDALEGSRRSYGVPIETRGGLAIPLTLTLSPRERGLCGRHRIRYPTGGPVGPQAPVGLNDRPDPKTERATGSATCVDAVPVSEDFVHGGGPVRTQL